MGRNLFYKEKSADMDKQQRDEDRRAYLKEHADGVMQELILQIVTHRPQNVVEFIHDWSGKKLAGEIVVKPKITEEVRQSMPKLVYPEEDKKIDQAPKRDSVKAEPKDVKRDSVKPEPKPESKPESKPME